MSVWEGVGPRVVVENGRCGSRAPSGSPEVVLIEK
ncbi:uncharacterized protein G2W53_031601 [Senna tora]|uniref:Uncharacterized protein n=1 Tax=Senna tora TaxID=362788 RepID=A0A834T9K7_9FABA|nr:uncharacterized protein G2W53_031601 [Senna tora]